MRIKYPYLPVFAVSGLIMICAIALAQSPGFFVDVDATDETVTGITIDSKDEGSGVDIIARSTGTNENLAIEAKGSGTITIGGTSTGDLTFGGGGGVVNISSGLELAATTLDADDSESALQTVPPGVTAVYVDNVTNDANDFITLPSLSAVPIGHTICVVAQAGANFEVRTPATSNEEINSEDCDGTKEYLFTDTQIHYFVKIDNTIGWMGHGYTAIGAVVTAVVPD